MTDTLDEYFEYEAEEFLVSLALLITEGRTPEYSIKGRTEGFHCPPAQSSQPPTTKHECSDKLAQVWRWFPFGSQTLAAVVEVSQEPTVDSQLSMSNNGSLSALHLNEYVIQYPTNNRSVLKMRDH